MFGDPVTNPKGWPKKDFSHLIDIVSGQVDPTQMPYRSMIHIGPANVESGTGELIELKSAEEDGVKSGKYLFDAECIVYSKIRPNLNKVATPDFQGVCSADMYAIKPVKEHVNKCFLVQILKSEDFLNYAISNSNRANIPKINRPALIAYSSICPPLSLQDKFQVIFKKLNTVKKNLKEGSTKELGLFNSLMQRAFKGELDLV